MPILVKNLPNGQELITYFRINLVNLFDGLFNKPVDNQLANDDSLIDKTPVDFCRELRLLGERQRGVLEALQDQEIHDHFVHFTATWLD